MESIKRSTSPEMENSHLSNLELGDSELMVLNVENPVNSEILQVSETLQVADVEKLTSLDETAKSTILRDIEEMERKLESVKNVLGSMKSVAQGGSAHISVPGQNTATTCQPFIQQLKDKIGSLESSVSDFILSVGVFSDQPRTLETDNPISANAVENDIGSLIQNDVEDSGSENVYATVEDFIEEQDIDLDLENISQESEDVSELLQDNVSELADMGLSDNPPPYSSQPVLENGSQHLSDELDHPPGYPTQMGSYNCISPQSVPSHQVPINQAPNRVFRNYNNRPNGMGNSQFHVNHESHHDMQSNHSDQSGHGTPRTVPSRFFNPGLQTQANRQAQWRQNQRNGVDTPHVNAHRFGQRAAFQSDHPPPYSELHPNVEQHAHNFARYSPDPHQFASNQFPQPNGGGIENFLEAPNFNFMRNGFSTSNRNIGMRQPQSGLVIGTSGPRGSQSMIMYDQGTAFDRRLFGTFIENHFNYF